MIPVVAPRSRKGQDRATVTSRTTSERHRAICAAPWWTPRVADPTWRRRKGWNCPLREIRIVAQPRSLPARYYRYDADRREHTWVKGEYQSERRGERFVAPERRTDLPSDDLCARACAPGPLRRGARRVRSRSFEARRLHKSDDPLLRVARKDAGTGALRALRRGPEIVREGKQAAAKNGNDPWLFNFREAWLRMLAFDFQGARTLCEAMLAAR